MADKYNKKRIAKAAKKLDSIINMSENVVRNAGITVKFKQYSANTDIRMVVENFYGFDFDFEEGETMFGGKDLVISYKGEKVLSLAYQDFCSYNFASDTSYFDGEVRFYKAGEWEKKLDKLAKNKQQSIVDYMRKNSQCSTDITIKEVYNNRRETEKFVEDILSGKMKDSYLDRVYNRLLPYIKQ